MEPFQEAYADVLMGPGGFEGTFQWPYLDTHKPPLVTVGTGCQIGRDEAVTIAWTVNNLPATPDQVLTNYDRVQHMVGGMIATAYRYPGCLILASGEDRRLLDSRIEDATEFLRGLFPGFDTFPDPAKTGMLEMPFTLGKARFRTTYPSFRVAVLDRDWKSAAIQSVRNRNDPAYVRRNQWTVMMFEKAALEEPLT